MNGGSRELTRGITAYLASLAFVLAFFITLLSGGAGMTPVIRGTVAALATMFVGALLLRPMMSVILDAMARDQAQAERSEDV